MRKKSVNAWKAQIEKERAKVAKLRDEIRDMASEMEELASCCDRAEENLQYAIDALSELA